VNVAVIGASSDRSKFGNKAVRAWANQGHTVFPVNPREKEIEGWQVYASVRDIPADLDAVLVYLPPQITLKVLPEIAERSPGQFFINPGAESPEVVEEAGRLGLQPILACAIVAIGDNPSNYSS
jgi:predicted CoA-binding protein